LRPIAVLLLLALATLLGLSSRPAAAQNVRFAPDPPEELVTQLMAHARSDLSRVTGTAGVPSETLLERNDSLLPIAEARAVIDVGFASGTARWCELDWRRNLANLLAEERARPDRSERQIAYIGVLHAHAMGVILDAAQNHRCTQAERATITDYMRRRWSVR
jgi:predicted secreted protein